MIHKIKNVSGGIINIGSISVSDNEFLFIYDSDKNVAFGEIAAYRDMLYDGTLTTYIIAGDIEYYEDNILKTDQEFYNFSDFLVKMFENSANISTLNLINSTLLGYDIISYSEEGTTGVGVTAPAVKDHTTAGYLTEIIFSEATAGINNRLLILESGSSSPDYTTAGLVTIQYVDSQISSLDIKDHTTAGYLSETVFDSATTGINSRIDVLEANSIHSPDYTTAGLASIQYVDSQISSLDIKDHTTAGYLSKIVFDNATGGIITELQRLDNIKIESYNDYTTAGLIYNNTFESATSGINNRLDILETNSIHSPDYTTAGLATSQYVDSQINSLDIKDYTTAGFGYSNVDVLSDLSDVDDSLRMLNYVLTWSGTGWYAANVDTISGTNGSVYLNDNADVSITSPSNNNILVYENGIWINKTLNDYTTAGLASVQYVDNQITALDIKDHTTAGYLSESVFENATGGIITELQRLDNIKLETYNDYTTASLAFSSDLNTKLDTVIFDSATTGINERLAVLEANSIHSPDYTTAGLASLQYVDSQISALEIKDHTTAGYLLETVFESATSGINSRLDVLEANSTHSPDYTTAGLATTQYVDTQIVSLDIKDHTTAGYGYSNVNILTDLSDVDDTAKNINYVLTWSGTGWYASSVDAISGTNGIGYLNDNADVNITAPSEGNVLYYNGSVWTNHILNDYTTAGLATTQYVDSQITALDIKDHTTAGYLSKSVFENATSGINIELQRLDSIKLEEYNDYTTASLAFSSDLDTKLDVNVFDSATSGINIRLDILEANSVHSPDYTTAGLASIQYVDSQIISLNIKDHTTAGYLFESIFDNATSGINDRLVVLESNPSNSPDYTTAGLATIQYVDSQINSLNIKDHTTGGYLSETVFDSATTGINEDIDLLWSTVNTLSAIDTLKKPDTFSPSGSYPTLYYGSAIESGDTWRITSDGTMGSVVVNPEDLLISLIDSPTQSDSDWMVVESNRDQATQDVLGLVKRATSADYSADEDTKYITPLLLKNIISSIGDHTTAGYLLETVFDNATTGLIAELQRLDNIKLETYNDYTTASLAFLSDLDEKLDINVFVSATTGINDRLDVLEANSTHSPDYTTAGLATIQYVDSQISTLDIKDHTTAGYLLESVFDNATTGINTELERLDAVKLEKYNDYTTAGLATTQYVDTQIESLDIKDYTTAGFGYSNVDVLSDLSDVDDSAKLTNYVLAWSGTGWYASPANTLTGTNGITYLTDNADVSITTPQEGDVLTYEGGEWINKAHQAVSTTSGNVGYAQFMLPENVNNTSTYFYSYSKPTHVNKETDNLRSGSVNGLANPIQVCPIIAPFDGYIVEATLILKGGGVQNATVTYPALLNTELYSVGFNTEGTKIGDINFSITNAFTVGTLAVGATNYIGSSTVNLPISKGETLSLKFVNGSGASGIALITNAFITITLKQN